MIKDTPKMLPKMVSSKDIQVSYKRIFEEALTVNEPIFVMKNNSPQVAIVSVNYLQDLKDRIAAYEEKEALDTLSSYEEDVEKGRLVSLNSLGDLLDGD